MIQLRSVSFAYGEKQVLQGVSFSVDDGEAVAIMGPSGSGKSTILRLILGLENASDGEVIVDGHDIGKLRESKRRQIRKNIGMVFQEGALFDSLTVGENVGYYLLEHSKLKWEEIDQRACRMLGEVGLNCDEVIDLLPEQLSGGMRRRVAIGRALLSTDPTIMLYDEPTTGLDPRSTHNILGLIEQLHREKNLSTVVVTHQIADAIAIADRYVVIIDGHMVFDGSLDELRDSRDPKVLSFLAPFRASVTGVIESRLSDVVAQNESESPQEES